MSSIGIYTYTTERNPFKMHALKRDIKPIIRFFSKDTFKIYSYSFLQEILKEKKKSWNLPANFSTPKFIDLLINNKIFKPVEISFPYRNFQRYVGDGYNILQLIQTFSPSGYFSHSTAMFLNKLADRLPENIYCNYEQSHKPSMKGKLLQSNIDRAFSRPQRLSNNFTLFDGYKIYLLNGKQTKNLGVIKAGKLNIYHSNPERTLIDIAVRPSYAGGVKQVLQAYQKAFRKISIKKLIKILDKLNYIYPYHQSIGFYMEKSNIYEPNEFNYFKKHGLDYDFYLDYNIKNPKYSKDWRIYYPADL